MSKQEVIISINYNNKVRVLYYFYLNLFCRKSRETGYPYSIRRPLDHRCSGGVSSRPLCTFDGKISSSINVK